MKRIDLRAAAGLIGLLCFVGTGAYMHFVLAHLQHTPLPQRLLFRATHIYLLLGSLHALAASFVPIGELKSRLLRVLLLAVAAEPLIFLVAFFVEPHWMLLRRPVSRVGLYIAFLSAAPMAAAILARMRRT